MRVLDRYADGRPRVTPWHRWVSGYTTRAGRRVAPYPRVRQGYGPQARAWQERQRQAYVSKTLRRELGERSDHALRQMMERRRMC